VAARICSLASVVKASEKNRDIDHRGNRLPDKSALPSPAVATRLAIAQHTGYNRAGDEAEDAAATALYLSKVRPGEYFLVRAIRPGYVAEPDRAGKRRITETGLWGVSPKQAVKWTKRHVTKANFAETIQRGHINRDMVVEALRRSRA
jgi:hypothetical protein